MHLVQALRLGLLPRLALVGAGGKTTALFQLAREFVTATHRGGLPETVLLTATTHMAMDQLGLADHHEVLETVEQVNDLRADLPPGVVLVTGPQVEIGRTSGLGMPVLERLLALANAQELPLLIEADGSRRRPLKAPAGYEPVIPAWVDTVVVVTGLSALGEPLSSEWVHRPERFAELSGLSSGDRITVGALARLLTSTAGGLKAIPPGARRVALLNQADTAQCQARAFRLAERLLPSYHAVLVAALAPPENSTSGPYPASPGEGPVFAVHEPVAGIILAAGASTRLGQAKQLLPWRDQPLVRHVARTALDAGLSPVVVVTGFAASEVTSALEDLPLVFEHNPNWEAGQSASICAGVRATPAETGAAVFLLADQPQVPAELVRGLVEIHARTLSPLVAPLVDGQRANPVLFDRLTFPDLMSLTGDVGGRVLFSRHHVSWLTWHDSGISLDVDTLEDYQRLLER